jgi:hypothetical protein
MGKEYRYYEDDLIFLTMFGRIFPFTAKGSERTGYDTQKPEKLLRRIIAVQPRGGFGGGFVLRLGDDASRCL